MSRRYWLPILAVVGLVLAAGADAQQASKTHGSQPSAAKSQPAPQQQPQPSVPPSLQHSLDRIGTALESANNKQTPQDETDRAKQDLAAQLRMADDADAMFHVGLAETVITFIGVLLVLGTLIYTRDAARDAKCSANAAENSLEEARRAANATVGAERDRIRPHQIFLNDGGVPDQTPNQMLQLDNITLRFRNGGRSAANIVAISVNRTLTEFLPDEPVYGRARPIAPAEQHIGANEPWEFTSWGINRTESLIEPEMAQKVLEGFGLDYWVYGYIDYDNFVGDRERRKFCAWLDGNRLAVEGESNLVLTGDKNYT
jgi:hypothetical protein